MDKEVLVLPFEGFLILSKFLQVIGKLEDEEVLCGLVKLLVGREDVVRPCKRLVVLLKVANALVRGLGVI